MKPEGRVEKGFEERFEGLKRVRERFMKEMVSDLGQSGMLSCSGQPRQASYALETA